MSHIPSLRDHVCTYINDKIKSGELKPHQKLSEVQICSDLNISRTPAREALIMLATDHIIDFIPRKGFYVKNITTEDILEYYSLMGNLDAFAASLALEYITEQDIIKMKESIAKMNLSIEYNNFDDYVQQQETFHNIYILKSHNTPLIETIKSLRYRYIPIVYNPNKTDPESYKNILHRINKEHEQILAYIEAKNLKALDQYIKYTHWNAQHIDLL